MNIHIFYDIIENRFHNTKFDELEKVIQHYPYFTVAAQAYLTVLYSQNQDTFLSELKNNAHLFHNRKFFFRQLKNQSHSNQKNQTANATTANTPLIPAIQTPQDLPTLKDNQESKEPVLHITPPEEPNIHHQIQTELNKAIADEIIQTEIFQIDSNIKNKTENLKHKLSPSKNEPETPKAHPTIEAPIPSIQYTDSKHSEHAIPPHSNSLSYLLKQYTQNHPPQKTSENADRLENKELTKKEKIKQQQQIIDKIISNPPKSTKISNTNNKFFSAENKAKESLIETEDLVTETLAQIYAAQGNIHKAIRAYEILSLKFPQKNTYFAARIEELKNQLKK